MRKEDQIIIDLFRKNDESGLQSLFQRFYRPLCVYAMKFLDDIYIAEDVTQEIFIRFWEEKKYKKIEGSLSNYLFTSVRNRSLNYLAKSKTVNTEYLNHLKEEFTFQQFEEEDIFDKKKKLYQEINKLPPQSQKVLRLIIFEGKKYKEVSEELNISLNTVKTHFSRALSQLRNSVCFISFLMII